MTRHDARHLSRTVLLALHTGDDPTVEAAIARHERTGVHITADAATCTSPTGQAATLTAVATAVRAFGHVHVHLDEPNAEVIGGLAAGEALGDAVATLGACLDLLDADVQVSVRWPELCLGTSTPRPSIDTVATGVAVAPGPVLRVGWSGWTGTVAPVRDGDGRRDDVCVLAAVVAAGLGVTEAFLWTKDLPGSDAGYRRVTLNLWSPGRSDDAGPALAYAPAAWWLVGLGHLGQAYAWVLSWIDYADPAEVEIVLQDTEETEPGNHSTGLLTAAGSQDEPKTRMVAAALDTIGVRTRIIERRLGSGDRVRQAEAHVALLGVDNIPTRRLTSGVGWRLAVDAGLGSGADDFTAMLIRRFPGTCDSADVAGWRDDGGEPARVPATDAFSNLAAALDECGLVELAGKAVGASFVGVVAACFAVAEAVREIHGGHGLDVLAVDLTNAQVAHADAEVPADVVALPLRQPAALRRGRMHAVDEGRQDEVSGPDR